MPEYGSEEWKKREKDMRVLQDERRDQQRAIADMMSGWGGYAVNMWTKEGRRRVYVQIMRAPDGSNRPPRGSIFVDIDGRVEHKYPKPLVSGKFDRKYGRLAWIEDINEVCRMLKASGFKYSTKGW